MAIDRVPPIGTILKGTEVASPSAQPATTTFRSYINFNNIVDGIIGLAVAHAGEIGGIKYVKEWWEDPAICGESEEFPCFYILPLYFENPGGDKDDKSTRYYSTKYIGDPLALTVFPVTVMAYYKYIDIRQPQRAVRNYGWNFYDILLNEMKNMPKLPGLKSTTPHIGWHMAGTNYIVQWWSLQLELASIL